MATLKPTKYEFVFKCNCSAAHRWPSQYPYWSDKLVHKYSVDFIYAPKPDIQTIKANPEEAKKTEDEDCPF